MENDILGLSVVVGAVISLLFEHAPGISRMWHGLSKRIKQAGIAVIVLGINSLAVASVCEGWVALEAVSCPAGGWFDYAASGGFAIISALAAHYGYKRGS